MQNNCSRCFKEMDFSRLNLVDRQEHKSGLPRPLAKEWLQDMRIVHSQHHKPLLDGFCCHQLFLICERFWVDTHIFLLGVHVLEKYLELRSRRCQQVNDPMLYVIASVYIASKMRADDYSSPEWNHMLIGYYMEGRDVGGCAHRHRRRLLDCEADILGALNFRLAIANEFEDLEIIVYMYMRPLGLERIMEPAEILLQIYFIHRKTIYESLVKRFRKSWIFQMVMRNRYFVPFVVVLAAFHLMQNQWINVRRMAVAFARIGCFDLIYLDWATKFLLKSWALNTRVLDYEVNIKVISMWEETKIKALSLGRKLAYVQCRKCRKHCFKYNHKFLK